MAFTHRYTNEQKQLALAVLDEENGNMTKTLKRLATMLEPTPTPQTIERWVVHSSENTLREKLDTFYLEEYEAKKRDLLHSVLEAAQHTVEELVCSTIKAKDRRDLAVTLGILTDKALDLREGRARSATAIAQAQASASVFHIETAIERDEP